MTHSLESQLNVLEDYIVLLQNIEYKGMSSKNRKDIMAVLEQCSQMETVLDEGTRERGIWKLIAKINDVRALACSLINSPTERPSL